ncbi:MAG: shikimate kinase [Pseudomonadota bacterium]
MTQAAFPETQPRLKRTVVLVGMMGSGKTAIGKTLASQLGVAFRDSDEALVEAANMSIPEIFERDGEAFFREKEAQIIARLMDLAPGVLSTGGGAFLNPATRDVIAARGISVWLKADIELLWERVRHKDTRPLLRTPDPRATLEALLRDRTPHYAQATLAVEAQAAYSIHEMTLAVIDALATRPDVLDLPDA